VKEYNMDLRDRITMVEGLKKLGLKKKLLDVLNDSKIQALYDLIGMFVGTYEKPKVKRFEETRLWNNLKRNK
jgi:hypothetical protein|tara:strand:- start:3127 stop:3342 length:216 start_codon:yes stop_codon:yes gene_type:complete